MCVIWGIPYLLIKVAVEDLSPAALVLARTALAAALLLPLAAARNELGPALRRWLPVLVFAGIEIAVPWILLGTAEQNVSSSLTGLLIAAVPLVGALIVVGRREERLSVAGATGLAIGLVGVAAIVGVNVEGAGPAGLVEIAGVVVCYAVGPLFLQRYLVGLPPLGVIALSLAAVAVAYVPIAAFSLPDEVPSPSVVGSVAALAVVCTALAFVLFFALIGEIGPVRATVITYVNPAVAAVLGVAILGESFSLGMGVGLALVLAGSVLATRPRRTPAPALEPA
jgi:drug/metabolite transporter (DMT)-like permease